ncbi:LysR family transcriptional regulator [Pseudomonas cavernae]|uniref:LysR family transcriptional regulator n=1 Tax=Pseudomonas cavernae TaxID=2320867 RepID=A0A385Z2R8_9PSED|nr:LysR family transcriptional regulator [Pseudomonas cavernae]AYC33064.1 LysR family transcriptional regulator [Pseudomonas cavernae]
MDLRQFRHFAALAENGSFVRAADVVGLSQPAFSRSIQALEQSLDCQLVDRSSRELRLTAQGQLVLQHARRLLAGARTLQNELIQYNGLTAGELRFGSGPSPAQLLVPEALADFIQAHPGIQIGYEINHWDVLAGRLKEEQLEFFVADVRYFVGDPQYQVQLLRRRRGRFFCRPGHPLLAHDSLKLAELLKFPIVGTRLPPALRKIFGQAVGQADFVPSIECGHFDAILRIVGRSQAVGLATMEALIEPRRRGEVALLRITDLPDQPADMQICYGIVSRAGQQLSPAAQAMVAVIAETDLRLAGDEEP